MTANTAYVCRAPGRIEVRSGRARVDAQGRCDGVGSEEIGSPEPSAVPQIGSGRALCFPAPNKNLHFFGETPERRPCALKARPAAFAGRSNLAFQVGIRILPTRTGILSRRQFKPAPRAHASLNLTTRRGFNVRTSNRNNVTRYTHWFPRPCYRRRKVANARKIPCTHRALSSLVAPRAAAHFDHAASPGAPQ